LKAMEKHRSSRKTEASKLLGVRKDESRESLPSADEPYSHEIPFGKSSDPFYGPFPHPEDLKAFEAKCIGAAARIIGGVVSDPDRIGTAVKTLKAVNDRAAKVFLLRVVEGKTETETASALKISRAAARELWRDAKRLIAESLENKTLSVYISMENAASNQEIILPSMIERATEVIGDRQEAMRWLGTPVRGLDYATPISLLGTEEGAQRVNDILGQIEHGVW
jgi:putative toxin-antitoxin system antitoxin component (TIGR02293 family)